MALNALVDSILSQSKKCGTERVNKLLTIDWIVEFLMNRNSVGVGEVGNPTQKTTRHCPHGSKRFGCDVIASQSYK